MKRQQLLNNRSIFQLILLILIAYNAKISSCFMQSSSNSFELTQFLSVRIQEISKRKTNLNVLTTPEAIIEQASTRKLLDDLLDESVRYSARKPIMMQFKPTPYWIWKRWKGTIFAESWPICIRNMIFAFFISLIFQRINMKQKLEGFAILWGQLLSVTTFTLTFFLNVSYGLWRKCYELSRRLQGRLNDLGLTLAAHAIRTPTPSNPAEFSVYTPTTKHILELISRYIRLFNILTYASFTRSHRPILTPRGMRRLVERGLMTANERSALIDADIPATQRHNAVILWIVRVVIEARQAGYFVGGAGFEQTFLEKIHVIRAQVGGIGDELQGRMPLAYAHIVQVLVDVVLILYPFMAFTSGMNIWLGVAGTGLLTIFYQGLFDLAKQFLDPYDNENFGNGDDPLCVDTLVAETNAGSIRWMNGFAFQPFDADKIREGEMGEYLLPLRGYSVQELEKARKDAEEKEAKRLEEEEKNRIKRKQLLELQRQKRLDILNRYYYKNRNSVVDATSVNNTVIYNTSSNIYQAKNDNITLSATFDNVTTSPLTAEASATIKINESEIFSSLILKALDQLLHSSSIRDITAYEYPTSVTDMNISDLTDMNVSADVTNMNISDFTYFNMSDLTDINTSDSTDMNFSHALTEADSTPPPSDVLAPFYHNVTSMSAINVTNEEISEISSVNRNFTISDLEEQQGHTEHKFYNAYDEKMHIEEETIVNHHISQVKDSVIEQDSRTITNEDSHTQATEIGIDIDESYTEAKSVEELLPINGNAIEENLIIDDTLLVDEHHESLESKTSTQVTSQSFPLASDDLWIDEMHSDGTEIRLSQMLADDEFDDDDDSFNGEKVDVPAEREENQMTTEEFNDRISSIIADTDIKKSTDDVNVFRIMSQSTMEPNSIGMNRDINHLKSFEETMISFDKKNEKASDYDQTALDSVSQLWGVPPDVLGPINELIAKTGKSDTPTSPSSSSSMKGIADLWGTYSDLSEANPVAIAESKVPNQNIFSSVSQLWGDEADDDGNDFSADNYEVRNEAQNEAYEYGDPAYKNEKLDPITYDLSKIYDVDWIDEVGPDGNELRLSQMLADEDWENEDDNYFESEHDAPKTTVLSKKTLQEVLEKLEKDEEERLETEAILKAAPGAYFVEGLDNEDDEKKDIADNDSNIDDERFEKEAPEHIEDAIAFEKNDDLMTEEDYIEEMKETEAILNAAPGSDSNEDNVDMDGVEVGEGEENKNSLQLGSTLDALEMDVETDFLETSPVDYVDEVDRIDLIEEDNALVGDEFNRTKIEADESDVNVIR